ncbi:hypothetical protein LZ31DRAFT_139108 [Colletotrichum somersetense]|nr:hypothetical protein LZ31DRAFT_139108 [Colletotrichum somersetense]
MRPPADFFAAAGPRRTNPSGRIRHTSGHQFHYPSSRSFSPVISPVISPFISLNPPPISVPELPSIEALEQQQQQSRRPEPCRKCGARFPSRSALFRHIYANNCTHRCRLCRQDFTSRNALFRHLPDCKPPSPAPSQPSLPSPSNSPSLPSITIVSSPPSSPSMSERSMSPVVPTLFSAAKFNAAVNALSWRIIPIQIREDILRHKNKKAKETRNPRPAARYTKPPPPTPLPTYAQPRQPRQPHPGYGGGNPPGSGFHQQLQEQEEKIQALQQ